MGPRDFYNKNMLWGRYQRKNASIKDRSIGKGPENFYDNPVDGFPFSYLNQVVTPTLEQIRGQQRLYANYITPINISGKDVTNELNKILTDTSGITNYNPEEAIKKIENIFENFDEGEIGSLYAKKGEQFTSQQLLNFINKHDNMIETVEKSMEYFINHYDQLGTSTATALYKLAFLLGELKTDITLAQQFLDENIIMTDASYLKLALDISWRLKGRYLEIEGINFLEENVPNDIKVVDLSQVYGPIIDIFNHTTIGSASAQLRSDIGLFNTGILDNVTIQWRVGKEKAPTTGTLREFFDVLENNTPVQQSIFIYDDVSLQTLYKNMVGVQAKSGKGAIQFLSGGGKGYHLTLDNLMQFSKPLTYLHILVNPEYGYGARFVHYHKTYNALANYVLGKMLTKIIGQENQLMLTRTGFMPVKDWLITSLDAGKIMYLSNDIDISKEDATVGVKFGKP